MGKLCFFFNPYVIPFVKPTSDTCSPWKYFLEKFLHLSTSTVALSLFVWLSSSKSRKFWSWLFVHLSEIFDRGQESDLRFLFFVLEMLSLVFQLAICFKDIFIYNSYKKRHKLFRQISHTVVYHDKYQRTFEHTKEYFLFHFAFKFTIFATWPLIFLILIIG